MADEKTTAAKKAAPKKAAAPSEPKKHTARKSGCPVCGSSDVVGLTTTRQCLVCGTQIDGDGNAVLEGKVDYPERVLGTTPAQPLPEAALVEQEGAPDLDRVRGTTPPQPLPVDTFDNPRVLGSNPPQPLPAGAGEAAPAVVYGDSTGATSDSPPDVHGDPVEPVATSETDELLKPKIAAEVEKAQTPEDAKEAADKMPTGGDSAGSQPKTDGSYATTSGYPTGETKIVTPGAKPVQPEIEK